MREFVSVGSKDTKRCGNVTVEGEMGVAEILFNIFIKGSVHSGCTGEVQYLRA